MISWIPYRQAWSAATVLFTLALSPVLADDSIRECRTFIRDLAAEHATLAREIQSEHDVEFADAIEREFARLPDDPQYREEVRNMLDAAIADWEIDRHRQKLVEETIEQINAHAEQEDDEFVCPQLSGLRRSSGSALGAYKRGLASVLEDASNRLDIMHLKTGEGLAIIAFYAFGYAGNIKIDRQGSLGGNIEFGPVANDQYFIVRKVKAGTYEWDEVSRTDGFSRYIHYYDDQDLQFTVAPGKLNYTGVFVFDSDGNYARGSLNDRTSIILRLLEQEYPGLTDYYDIVNGLVPEDRFLEFYFAEKEARLQETEQ